MPSFTATFERERVGAPTQKDGERGKNHEIKYRQKEPRLEIADALAEALPSFPKILYESH
jgi:hypothetical protein